MYLTEYQKEFILENFFKNEQYPGWKNIGNSLLNKGWCVVAGTSPIYIGGIGNFIKTSEALDFIDCLTYSFNLEEFLESEWFKEIQNNKISEISNKLNSLQNEYNDMCKL